MICTANLNVIIKIIENVSNGFCCSFSICDINDPVFTGS